ncbi:tetratricopeptide repeat protein [Amycolatopsis sp. CA-128772]|uniref:tetratricopeptide repeat protein n=1 Tax=Amycolatopsis sp. CA-128772 TaxID=2073159 RepID=UPI001E493F59|nr:tetratricopeptide repeat protein [Amycolatopsis sp. CA-128772]
MVTAAAVVSAVLTAAGKIYPGAVVAGVVAAVGAVVAVVAERGRAHIAERAAGRSKRLYVERADRAGDPLRLGVHPAAWLTHADGRADRVPPFVARDRMPDVEAALKAGGFVLVVGDSTAGKSRLAYEAMRSCLPRHVCVRPVDSAALPAAIGIATRKRRSVLWLDDLDQYLGADGLTRSDVDGLGPRVVVLATLRAHLRDEVSARYDTARPASERTAARAGRQLLDAVTAEVRLDRTWSPAEVNAARDSPDPRIALAVGVADKHGLAETMAAGPALLRDWHDAWSATPRAADRIHGDARGAALVSAAVDIRRAGYQRPLELPMLRDLHEVYLADRGGALLHPGSWENALAWATAPLHATSSLLDPQTYQAFDYLVNEAVLDPATPPVPEAVWRTLLDRLAPDDVVDVAWRADYAGYVRHVEPTFHRVLESRHYRAAAALSEVLDNAALSHAPDLLETTISRAGGEDDVPAEDLLAMRHSLAWMLGERIGGHGDPERALGMIRQVVRDGERLLGRTHAQVLEARLTLARQLGARGEHEQALSIATDLIAVAVERNGQRHASTLNARFEAAVWTRHLHGAAAGAEQFRALLKDARSIGTAARSFVLDTAWNLGGSLLDSGDAVAAVPILDQLVVESERAYGSKHAQTLPFRRTQAAAIGAAGDPARALELTRALVEDSTQILGETHLTTLEARADLAGWLSDTGDTPAAIELLDRVLDRGTRQFGEDHWLMTEVRAERARLRGREY